MLYLLEAGHPSTGCTTTPADQSAFFEALLTAWSRQNYRVPLISLTWLRDISAAETADYSGCYGIADDCFARCLASLGLRESDGNAKPALTLLLSRASD